MMTDEEIIEVVQARIDGKTIQVHIGSEWQDTQGRVWNFALNNYRAKPKLLELWVNVYSNKNAFYQAYKDKSDAVRRVDAETGKTFHMVQVDD